MLSLFAVAVVWERQGRAAGAAGAQRPMAHADARRIPSRASFLPPASRPPSQIGDVLLDVNPGIPPRFRQDVAIVSAQSKRWVMLGDVRLRMVASPNVETLLDPEDPLPTWQRTGAAAAAEGGKAAAAAAARGKRAFVVDDESSEDVEEMDVDGAAAAAANGTQQGPVAGQQQQQQQQQQRAGKQLQGVVVKSEAGEEEEVVSPRRGGGLRSPRGRKAAGGGGSGGGAS